MQHKLVLVFLLLLPSLNCYLCSAFCALSSCSPTSSDCTSCPTNWIPSGSSCQPDSTTYYSKIAASSDVGWPATVAINPSNQTNDCSGYIYNGDYECSTQFQISLAAGMGVPHYSIEASMWVIFPDDRTWTSPNKITITDGSNQQLYTMGSSGASESLCNSLTQTYYRISLSLTHINATSSPITLQLFNDVANSSCIWGIKEVVFIAQICHSSCLTCSGPLNTQCYTCAATFYLSGNTCSAACLAGYGQITSSYDCVLCNTYCSACSQIPTNCSACNTTAPSQAFLSGTSCITGCPTATFANTANHKCDPCPSNCDTCSSATVCTTCSSTYALLTSTCYNPCPLNYFMNGAICSSCDPKCAVCAVSSTNCSQCTATGGNVAYLSGTSCITNCPTATFANSANHKCDPCPSNCDACSSGTVCTSCSSTYGLLSSICYNPCPGATFYDSGVCSACNPKCTLCSTSATICSQCSTAPPVAYLSGSSCVTSCTGSTYSTTTPSNLCLSCDPKCSQCTGPAATQCSSCSTSVNEAFLSGTQCLVSTSCPTTTFANTANHKCDPCSAHCDVCSSATVCTTCSATYGLLTSACYNPCPGATFMNSGTCSSCDLKCATCTGALDSECQSCASGNTLSGSTCAASCLANYGPSGTTGLCLSCNALCSSCNLVSTNCSACTTSGADQAFLNSAATPTPTCVISTSCPSTTFASAVNHVCDTCDASCKTCSMSATNCTSCATGKGWSNFVCYSTCPTTTFMNGTNCSSCDSLCKICTTSSTNCTQCQTDSPNIGYLSTGNTCLANCPPGDYKNNNGGAGPNVCSACTSACTLCQDATANLCQACSTNFTLSGTKCSSSCLSGYGPSSTPNVCIACTLPCLTCNLSATNCTTCDMSGGTLYLYNTGGNIYDCVVSCPISTFINMTTPSCDACPSGCYECANKNYCYSCNYASGYMWVNTTHLCYKPCPANFYNSSSTNCSACNVECYRCVNAPDNCTQCQTSGTFRGFLLTASCFTICPSGLFGNTTTNKCQACHANCANCFNATKNDCSICNNPYILSGTTCDVSCAPYYGVTVDLFNCVACNATCISCAYLSTNCSSCQTSGNFTAYLYIYNSSYAECLEACPVGYFQNTTDHNCSMCNPNCSACDKSANNCSACITGFALLNSKCYQPCPDSYYKNGLVCSKCNSKCLLCTTSSTNCQACVISGGNKAYLLGSTCYTACPATYYNFDNNTVGPTICLKCDNACTLCSESSINCSACNTSYYLFNSNTCLSTCPTGYFPYNATQTCIDSKTLFVTLSADIYFSSSTEDQIYVDFVFNRDLSTTTFPLQTFQTFTFSDPTITSLNFTFTYTWINSSAYRVTLTPTTYIFLYNCTVTATTMAQPALLHTAADGVNFDGSVYSQTKSIVWYCIYAPQSMQSLTKTISATSDNIREFTTLPFIQQINKAGILSLIFTGCQITSSIIVTNNVYSPHFYEGSRLFANFVYFQAPNWEKNRTKTKYVVSPSADTLVSDYRLLHSQRTLFDVSSTFWRYQRTGFTTFFIVDCYTQFIVIAVVWLLVIVGRKIQQKYKRRIMPKIYPIFHTAHEIMVFYFAMGLVLQWTYFDSSSPMRVFSLMVAILSNVYLLCYVLYIYYKMIDYFDLEIGSEKYRELTLKYGCFVRNLRYEEYEQFKGWSPKHLFRPYNYHLLSYYKKFLMILSLPIFYEYPKTQIGVLIALQVMQMVRFCITWPYVNRKRNLFKLLLQIILLLFFVITLIQALLIAKIQQNQASTMAQLINLYSVTGWIGVIFIFVFNISYFILLILNIVDNCKRSSMDKIRQTRRNYYYQKLTNYQKSLENHITVEVLDSWVIKGDLNQKWIDDDTGNSTVRLPIERFIINKMGSGFTIQIEKIAKAEARASKFGSLKQKVKIIQKIQGTIGLSKQLNKSTGLLRTIEELFQKYDPDYKANFLTLKTIAKINTQNYLEGDPIKFSSQQLSQVITLCYDNNHKETHQLAEPLNGFPIQAALLKQIVADHKQQQI